MVSTYAIGTTEFAPVGILSLICGDMHISLPEAGQVISTYALGVMVSGPFVTLALARLRRPVALMACMAIFAVGNLLVAAAPNYSMLLIGRVVTSLGHSAFIGIGAVVAASLVSENRKSSAVAIMFSGITIANIAGVPAVAWIGHHLHWRWSFVAIAVLGIYAAVALGRALPPGDPGRVPNARDELKVLTRPTVVAALATSALSSSAMFTLYTYIAPLLSAARNASEGFITLGLTVVGIGFTVGAWVGGRLADWSLERSAKLILSALAISMMFLPFLIATRITTSLGLFTWSVLSFAIIPPLQSRLMKYASDAPILASSINAGAFNLGNAVGAFVGGFIIETGLDVRYISVAGGAFAAVALVTICTSRPESRRI